jgi:hypothetical protein
MHLPGRALAARGHAVVVAPYVVADGAGRLTPVGFDGRALIAAPDVGFATWSNVCPKRLWLRFWTSSKAVCASGQEAAECEQSRQHQASDDGGDGSRDDGILVALPVTGMFASCGRF